MTVEYVMTLFYEATKIGLIISAPLLLSVLFTGLIISLLQAVTQVNEQTLSFIPKLISILITIIILGPWMLGIMSDYIKTIFYNIPLIIR
ncbi:flagellar biosynthesis protein FliQ [Buchnera aphidicola (Pemphigus obesinymphae)]|uniref:flagellar biosynthesis protein FliQ n=1 Tax=Buchnera aphidicola TaxID=9 RepID=UPI002237D0D0|nr:flagellar biosynthesis protein FliQ [Buchnera aphidicola]MCW5196836.1 flagellar biosynthesis protein FliQ [Buchnera aphidicola (Pemphigus obesinymphae)]